MKQFKYQDGKLVSEDSTYSLSEEMKEWVKSNPKDSYELGKDFKLDDDPAGWQREYYPNGDYKGEKTLKQIAVPIKPQNNEY